MVRIRNDDVRKRMDVDKPLTAVIEQEQLTFQGHMRRMSDDRMAKKIWEQTSAPRRKRERPWREWNKEILEASEKRGLNIDIYTDKWGLRLGCGYDHYEKL